MNDGGQAIRSAGTPKRGRGRPRNEVVAAVAERSGEPPRLIIKRQHAARARAALGDSGAGLAEKVLVEFGIVLAANGWNDDWHSNHDGASVSKSNGDTEPKLALPPEAKEWLASSDCVVPLLLQAVRDMQSEGYSADLMAQRLRSTRLRMTGGAPRGVDYRKAVARIVTAIVREAALVDMDERAFVAKVLEAFEERM